MNKHTRKSAIYAAVLSVIMVLTCLSATGCSGQSPESVLYRRGMSIVHTICDISASDDYMENLYGKANVDLLYIQPDEGVTYKELLNEIHYRSADAVFMIDATVQLNAETDVMDVSESLQKEISLQEKQAVSFALSLAYDETSSGDLAQRKVVLSSLLTATELFVCEGVREDSVTNYLYVFREGFPIMVSFRAGRDGAVQGVGKVLFDRELNLTSEDELKAYLEDMYKQLRDVTVERVR